MVKCVCPIIEDGSLLQPKKHRGSSDEEVVDESGDKKNIQRIFRLDNVEFGKPLTLLLFISLPFAFGFWGEAYAFSDASVILWNCIAIMHFWYDGFIWSVRKKEI